MVWTNDLNFLHIDNGLNERKHTKIASLHNKKVILKDGWKTSKMYKKLGTEGHFD